MIKVVISREIFEHRFGETLHRIQHAIDEEFPIGYQETTSIITATSL